MEQAYNFKSIEQRWQNHWSESQTYDCNTITDRPCYYCLAMFPYTSGEVHMGHARVYTISDLIARYERLQGKQVLQPIGWDSFGLPAENAARKHKTHPNIWTQKNIQSMGQSLKQLGFAYDWKRSFATCDPDYYRWQQWLFIQMFNKGLVYKKDAWVNWDPVDQTVLANEQVIDGRGWRSDALVERKKIGQWFCKISDYADRLLDDLDTLDQWPEAVKVMQRNWIGKSSGTLIHFKLDNHNGQIDTFTTRVDTLYGATYLAIAPDHPLAINLAKDDEALSKFLDSCRQQSTAEADLMTAEKKGYRTQLLAKHPLLDKTLPVWVANYVLSDYGTGAIMAVPAHDERDLDFAKLYALEVIQVIEGEGNHATLIHSDKANGLTPTQARAFINQQLTDMKAGEIQTTYRLRDWGISRQRYWGVPIPMIHCSDCGTCPAPEASLPIELPLDCDYGDGLNVLNQHESFKYTTCPKCQKPATRETDTFDTFFDSSWYYLYFVTQGTDCLTEPRFDHWLPVDTYVGGIEHAILHLLYARFIQKVLADLGLTDVQEPFKRLLSQGMVLKDGAKMSKSKGNVVVPSELINRYGADTVRFFMTFAAPPEQSLEWSDSGVEGCFRFLKRVHHHCMSWQSLLSTAEDHAMSTTGPGADLRREAHQLLQQVNRDMNKQQLNTVASGIMKLFSVCQQLAQLPGCRAADLKEVVLMLLRMLYPIAPHCASELWQVITGSDQIEAAGWPEVDQPLCESQSTFTCVIQVNGKTKGTTSLPLGTDKKTVEDMVKHMPAYQAILSQATIKKVIVVPNKLINFVIDR